MATVVKNKVAPYYQTFPCIKRGPKHGRNSKWRNSPHQHRLTLHDFFVVIKYFILLCIWRSGLKMKSFLFNYFYQSTHYFSSYNDITIVVLCWFSVCTLINQFSVKFPWLYNFLWVTTRNLLRKETTVQHRQYFPIACMCTANSSRCSCCFLWRILWYAKNYLLTNRKTKVFQSFKHITQHVWKKKAFSTNVSTLGDLLPKMFIKIMMKWLKMLKTNNTLQHLLPSF